MRGWEGSSGVRGRAGTAGASTHGQPGWAHPLTQGRHQGGVMPQPGKKSGKTAGSQGSSLLHLKRITDCGDFWSLTCKPGSQCPGGNLYPTEM